MRVLVACEFSQIVTKAFRDRGHEAFSCDILPTEGAHEWHIQGDVLAHLDEGWDLMIAHPPCTDLAVSGARYFKEKIADGRQQRALDFVRCLMDSPIEKIAIENPVSVISSKIRRPDQVIQPWMFGHGETKATCLWLKNLPLLQATHRDNDLFCEDTPKERAQRIHKMPPSPDRWRERSRTFVGIAQAMAEQWG